MAWRGCGRFAQKLAQKRLLRVLIRRRDSRRPTHRPVDDNVLPRRTIPEPDLRDGYGERCRLPAAPAATTPNRRGTGREDVLPYLPCSRRLRGPLTEVPFDGPAFPPTAEGFRWLPR